MTDIPFLPGTEVLFMRDVVFGVVVPWVSMLPFVLVAIATIEMIKGWLPSRLPDDPPTEPLPHIVVVPGPNGFALRVTDPLLHSPWTLPGPERFIAAGDP